MRENEKPCREAQSETLHQIDRDESEGTIEEIKAQLAKLNCLDWHERWLACGENHREEDGHITRDFFDPAWVMKFGGLGELMDFVRLYGECIVSESEYENIDGQITIYDDYRE